MSEHENVYEDLRANALDAAELNLPARSTGHPDVIGVVIDIPADGGYATLVAMTDGATSLYTDEGGGIIGAGEHKRVAEANARLLRAAQGHLSGLRVAESVAHPLGGVVRMFVITRNERRVADISEREFWGEEAGQLSELVAAAQEVMTEMQQVEPN